MNDAAPSSTLADVGELDRTTYLGSSDAAAVMCLAPVITRNGRKTQRTAYTTYLAKRGELVTEFDEETKLFLRRRKRWEAPIVEMLHEEYDGKIVGVNRRYKDPEHDFMAAEIDFEWVDEDGVIQNGEIKTVHAMAFGERHGWGEPGTDQIPVHYLVQVCFGMMVTGRSKVIVAAMVGLDNMIFYRVERDEEFLADIRARCLTFWFENVKKGIPPDAQTLSDIKTMMLRKQGRPCQLDAANAEKLRRLDEARDSIKALGDEVENLSFELGDFVCKSWDAPNPYLPPAETKIQKKVGNKTVIIDPLADAGLYYGGKRIGSWNKQSGAFLDQKLLKEEKPEIVAEYTKGTVFRVVRVHN